MRCIASLLIALFLFVLSANADNGPNQCVSCHLDWEDDDGPAHLFTRDIHNQRGLGCQDCHGGDPALDDMELVRESADYRGVPGHIDVPEFCASCHSDADYMRRHDPSLPVDQLAKFRTSVHGQRLYAKADVKVANCVSCHTAHEIGDGRLPHSSTHPLNIPSMCGNCHSDADYMAEYGISTKQVEEYTQSVHGQALLEGHDLGAPACNGCHGNHGAAPPAVSSLAAVCGVCHALEEQLFSVSPHAAAFAENDFPMCETCHSNHLIIKPSDDMIGTGEAALCSECHDPEDGTSGSTVAIEMLATIRRLVAARSTADSVLAIARDKGMLTTDDEFLMKEVDQSLIQARTQIHAFTVDSVEARAVSGMMKADSVRVHSAGLIEEYYFRRTGLVIATMIITFLAVMLYRKIRIMER